MANLSLSPSGAGTDSARFSFILVAKGINLETPIARF
jgi:hypothetical protein